MKRKVIKLVANVVAAVGIVASGASCIGCFIFLLEEPEMPKSMIK